MSEIKNALTESDAFDQWVEEYRKGKPYWSTARIEICRDAWMERATRDVAPELLEALIAVVSVADRATVEFDKARAAIAKATGSQS